MRNPNHKVITALIIACLLAGVVLISSSNRENASVKIMLEKRSDIIDNTLSGKITFEEGKKKLNMIETDKLYSDDVRAIKGSISSEHVEKQKMKVLSVEKIQQVSNIQTYGSKIQWTCIEDGTVYYRNNEYIIGVKENKNKLKLVSFELIE